MFIKTTALIIALGVTPVLTSSIVLANSPADPVTEDLDIASGKIVSIDQDNSQFSLEVAPLDQIEISWNDDTAFSLNGEAATAGQVLIIAGLVTVEHSDGVATSVRSVTEEEAPQAPATPE